jgi:hypothetical protein
MTKNTQHLGLISCGTGQKVKTLDKKVFKTTYTPVFICFSKLLITFKKILI